MRCEVDMEQKNAIRWPYLGPSSTPGPGGGRAASGHLERHLTIMLGRARSIDLPPQPSTGSISATSSRCG